MDTEDYGSRAGFSRPKEPTKVEDLYARGFSKKHRRLSDGRTVVIKYSDSMRTPKDSRFQAANVPVMTEMYQIIKGRKGEPDTFKRLNGNDFTEAFRELTEQYKTKNLGAEDLAPATGREVSRVIRRRSGL